MSDITDFLLARIAEDEAAVESPSSLPAWLRSEVTSEWYDPSDESMDGFDDLHDASREVGQVLGIAAKHLRPRVLRECEAKRRIVELHPEMLEWCQGCASEPWPCRTLRHLASIHADHPNYRPEWAI